MKKISIIIPCYNCEKTIKKTVESIQTNSYTEKTEIILVNDGSKDKTSEVLDKLSKEYNNVKVINKENTGVSETRNVGIDACTGDYITFVDSDDYIINDCYKQIIKVLENKSYDIIYFNFLEEHNNKITKSKYKLKDEILNRKEFMNKFLSDEVSISSWDKIYRTELVKKTMFNKEMAIGEDALFVTNIINKADKIKVIDKYFYVYIQNERSTVHELNRKIIQLAKVGNYINEDIKSKYQELYSFFDANLMLKSIHHISNNRTKENHKEAYQLLKEIYSKEKINILLNSKKISKFTGIELRIMKVFGINIHLTLFRYYKKIKNIIRRGE